MAIADTNITNDNFWSNMAAEAVYNSADKRSKSVDALKTLIIWAFALFSVGGFMLTLFGNLKEFNFWALLSFGVAFFLLTIGYMLANRALYPIEQRLNSNVINDIKAALSDTNKKQTARFKWAAGFTATGFFFVALGILLQFSTIKNAACATKPTASFYMKAGVEKRGDSTYIPVTVMSKKNEAVTLSFINSGNIDSTTNNKKIIFSRVFYTDTSGRLYYTHHLACDTIKKLVVKATVKEQALADTVIERSMYLKISLSQ